MWFFKQAQQQDLRREREVIHTAPAPKAAETMARATEPGARDENRIERREIVRPVERVAEPVRREAVERHEIVRSVEMAVEPVRREVALHVRDAVHDAEKRVAESIERAMEAAFVSAAPSEDWIVDVVRPFEREAENRFEESIEQQINKNGWWKDEA